MINEYDIVVALRDLNSKVLKGCEGTVVFVFDSIPPAYMVEFVDDEIETLDVLTVKFDDIEKLVDKFYM